MYTCYTIILLMDVMRVTLQGYDILEDMYSPKTAAANFAHDLCRKKRNHLDAFMGVVAGG